jgi:hypothetical protein
MTFGFSNSPRKVIPIFIVAITCILPGLRAEERTWTSDDGKELVGEWVSDSEDSVVVRTKGKEFKIPLLRLSEADREWIAARREERAVREKEARALAGTYKTFAKSDRHQVTYHVYYPSGYSLDAPPPMLILFSASGRGKSMVDAFKESADALGWVTVGCDTFRNGVDDSELDPLFRELLPVIEETVAHNPERLYTGGMSGGAARALQYTAKFDRPWKGVISCGGWLGKAHDLEYRKGMAVAWVNGDTDKGANFWIEPDSAVLSKRRCKTKVFAFPGGHVIGPPEVLTEAMRWVDKNSGE